MRPVRGKKERAAFWEKASCSMKQIFITQPLPHPARQNAIEAIRNAPDGMVVEIKEKTRTLEQNSLLWPLLQCVSNQVNWYGHKLTPENWKDVFSAALKKSQIVPGIDGGFVALGLSTSKLTKKDFSDLIEIIYAFGTENGVKFQS